MKHSEFWIGLKFWCGGRRWSCTDIGTRIVTAISLEPHEIVEFTAPKGETTLPQSRRHITDDTSWLKNPPYAVAESIFDENDMKGCSMSKDDQ